LARYANGVANVIEAQIGESSSVCTDGEEYAPRILVLENAPAVRGLIVRLLLSDGYNVVTAATGYEALEVLRTKAFQLVVADLSVPDDKRCGDITSIARIQLLRRIYWEFPRLKVLATGRFKTETAADAIIAAGATAILAKPITVRSLWNAVYRVLDPSCGWVGRRIC
jgi:CheY-like chemotaxis protein